MPSNLSFELRPRRFSHTAAMHAAAALAGVLAAADPSAAAAQSGGTPAYRLARTIALPGTAAQGWDSLACDPDAGRVYVAHGSAVDVIDTASGQLAGKIGGLSEARGIALDPQDERGFVADGGGGTVVVFDLATLKTLATVPVAAEPDAVAYQPYYHRVTVFSGAAERMTVLDAKTGKPLGMVALPGRPASAAAARNGFVYATIADRNEIVEIDPRAFTVGNTYPVAPGAGPAGIAIDSKNNRLFTACANQTLIAMDDVFGGVLSSLPIDAQAGDCVFDPGLSRVYAIAGRSGVIAVANRLRGTDEQYTVASTIATLPGAHTMTVDTKTHHLFVAGASRAALVVQEYAPAGR